MAVTPARTGSTTRLLATTATITRFEQLCLDLLRHAYVSARYAPDYQFGDDELDWLMDQVGLLQATVAKVCTEQQQQPWQTKTMVGGTP